MNTKATPPPAAPAAQESYIVSEGKKRGSTREVRPEAAFDRYCTVLDLEPSAGKKKRLPVAETAKK